MLYAKVVLGLAVEGPFDYIIPESLAGKILPGIRVKVSFRTQKLVGYVVAVTRQSSIKNLKNILEVIDEVPVLSKNMLQLTREIADYYGCSWGEAVETALPETIRKVKKMDRLSVQESAGSRVQSGAVLLHDLDGEARWQVYLEEIRKTIDAGSSAIVLVPDIVALSKAKERISNSLGIPVGVLYRKQPREADEWLKARNGVFKVIVGTRSGVFAPFDRLGLIIIDEEEYSVYKQDQVPHYHAREAGLMRANLEKSAFILGSSSPSLESYYLTEKNKIKYVRLSRSKAYPEIKINDDSRRPFGSKQKPVLSKYLQDSIAASLEAGEKILLFINRKGFATYSSCSTCGASLKCPRCSINLVYHSDGNILSCHYCNFKQSPPKICPVCESGYIRYLGTGAEKIENEISRLFPQAKIKLATHENTHDLNDSDIFISTESILKGGNFDFGLIGVISIDNTLNRVDFRSSEKAFDLLIGLVRLASKKMIIQTGLGKHYCIRAIETNDIELFYREELKNRKQLSFPPYKHIGLVKLRGGDDEKVKSAANRLFDGLKEAAGGKSIEVVSVNPGQPVKLRGKFCWQVLLISGSAQKLSKFLKKYLKGFLHSGIIATIDIDPV